MASIDEQITANTKRIQELNSQITGLNNSARDWQADSDNDVCNQKLKSNRLACETEKARKAQVARDRKAAIPALQAIINNLTADNKELTKQRAQEGQAMINLSNQGLTVAAVNTKAKADADAVVQIAGANANTIEKTADVKAQADSMNNKVKTGLMFMGGLLMLAVLGFLVYQKVKPTK